VRVPCLWTLCGHKRRPGARAIRAAQRVSNGSKDRRLPLDRTPAPLGLRVGKIRSQKRAVQDHRRERNDMVANSRRRAPATQARQAPRPTHWAADLSKSGVRPDATQEAASALYKMFR